MRIFSGLTSEKQKKIFPGEKSSINSYHDEYTKKEKLKKNEFLQIILHYVDDRNLPHSILDMLSV